MENEMHHRQKSFHKFQPPDLNKKDDQNNARDTRSAFAKNQEQFSDSNEQLGASLANQRRGSYFKQTSTPTNLNSKRRIQATKIARQQTSEVKSNISRIRHTSITTTSCVSTKVCGKERINQYQIMQKIGVGAFSEVFVCFDVSDNKVYAMKVMNKARLRRKTINMKANAFDNVK